MTTNETQIEQNNTLRRRLEELEDEVEKSWLRDLDKVTEINAVTEILKQMLKLDALEDYFDNAADFDYFMKKFSHKIISNIILAQYCFWRKQIKL